MGVLIERVTGKFRLNEINPLIYWISLLYFLTRIVEWIFESEPIWTRFWIAIVDKFGETLILRKFLREIPKNRYMQRDRDQNVYVVFGGSLRCETFLKSRDSQMATSFSSQFG